MLLGQRWVDLSRALKCTITGLMTLHLVKEMQDNQLQPVGFNFAQN
jgi:hypothetical protein